MRDETCGIRTKYRHTAKLYNTAIICWLVAISVTIGNTFYELNCWAGGIDAVMSLPGAAELDNTAVTVGCSVGYAVLVILILVMNKTDILGVFLGVSKSLYWSIHQRFESYTCLNLLYKEPA